MRYPHARCRGGIAMCRRGRRDLFAFTLVESLVALSLLAALSLITLPSVGVWMQRLRVDWTVQSILAALNYARAEAVRRGVPVTVCRSGPDDRCSSQSRVCDGRQANGTDWRCGWIVVPGHRRQLHDRASPSVVLRRFASAGGTAVIASNYPRGLTFRPPAGQATGSAGNLEVGVAPYAHCVRIGMLGRAAVEFRGCR